MILSVSYQLKIFLISLFIGLILGFFYDLLKIFRKYIIHNNFIINIEDTIYWLFMSIIIFLISLYQNNGEIRIFFIIGIFTSMILYTFLISPIFLNISTKIINVLIKIILFIFRAISMPFLIIFNIILKPLKKLIYLLKNILKKLLKKYSFCVTIYNKGRNIKFYLKSLIIKGDKTKDEEFRK
ncbi:spore cortex biosynthesis protein YabQ [[Clostridium] colinum]|uniref:spore cortex biosynthesis protein YabQ n=1 Tax=[Clostridium] colinum TaxID=36835 RepID=UPI002023CCDF|nr:spore cortex biosynthesis protein YabQ [[Clostridium] colinum]